MAWEIYRNDPGFPIHPVEFERAYPITGYESFFRWWEFINPIEGKLAHFYPILGRHIERLRAQRVVYTEVMIAAGELPQDGAEAVDKVAALRAWVHQQERGEIQVEFLIPLQIL